MNRFVLSLAAVATVAFALAGFTATDVALGTVVPAAAQSDQGAPSPGAPQRGQRFGKMLLALNLSDDQKNRIRAIMADARAKSKTLTDRDEKRAAMRAAFAQIDTVLTPAQRTKLHAQMAAARAQREGTAPHS